MRPAKGLRLTVGFPVAKPLGTLGETDLLTHMRALTELGHQVVVVAPAGPATVGRPTLPSSIRLLAIDLQVTRKRNPLPSTAYAHRAAAVLRAEAPELDVVHTLAFPEFGLYLGRLARVPSVLSVRSLPISSVPAWRVGRGLIRLQRRLHEQVLVVGDDLARAVFGRTYPELPNPVDLEAFRPGPNEALRANLGIPSGRLVAVYTGATGPLRRPETLIETLRQAVAGGVDLHLLILGTHKSAGRLRDQGAGLGIEDRLTFARCPHEDVGDYLRVADIALAYVPIVPQYLNQPPIKTVEYLAVGLPTVATATRGNLALVQHEENGLVTSDDAEAVAAAVRRLAHYPGLRERLGQAGRQSVLRYGHLNLAEQVLLPTYRAAITAYRSRRR